MSEEMYSHEDLETINAFLTTKILVMNSKNSDDLYQVQAQVCAKQQVPLIAVAPVPGERAVSIRVECYSAYPPITSEQWKRVYAALAPFGEVVPLSVPAPENLARFSFDWGIANVPEPEAPALLADLLAILEMLPPQPEVV